MVLAWASALSGVPVAALAGTWTLTPEFSVGAEYSSNPQLHADTPSAGEAATLHLGAPLDWSGDAKHLQLTPRARLGAAGGDSSLGADAFYFAGAGELDTELGKLSLTGRLADDSSVVRQPDSGTLTRSDVRQRDLKGELGWTRALTERTSLEVGLSNQRVSYGAGPDVGLFDYRYRVLTGQLSRRISERLSLVLTADRTHYELPDRVYHEDSTDQQLGLSGAITALWSFRALYGRSRVGSVGSRQNPVGSVYEASLERNGPRSSLVASTTRSLKPSGFGVLAQTLESKAKWSWAETERRIMSVSWRSVETRNVFGSLTFADRKYYSLAADLSWKVSEFWDLEFEVNHVRAESAAGALAAPASAAGTGAMAAFARRFGRVRLK